MNTTFSVYDFVLFIYFTINLEGTALRRGTWLDNICFLGASAFLVLKSASGRNEFSTNK